MLLILRVLRIKQHIFQQNIYPHIFECIVDALNSLLSTIVQLNTVTHIYKLF